MRIAFLAAHGSVHTRRWVSFFAERGHEVHVVTCGAGPAAAGYLVHDLGAPRPRKAGYLLKAPAARRLVRALRPDVVHAHYATSYGLLGLATGIRPLVVTAHGDDVLVAPRRWHMRGIVRNVIRRADLVTVPGNHMKPAITALAGASMPPVSVFQYGVESDRLIGFAHERRGDSTEARTALRVISTRPLIPDSRIDLLLEALAILRARGVACDCEVLGGGPEQRRLERDVESLGLEGRVRLRGHVPPGEVEHTVARSDVCVSVARSDGASMSLLEGMALGAIPVVADLPANREWVSDGTNGVVTAPLASDLADAIERSATLDRRRAVEENQRLVHDRADRAVNLAASERLLQELVERKRLASVDG